MKTIDELERRRLQRQMFALEDEKEAVEARYKYLLKQARVGLFSLSAGDCRLIDANSEMIHMFLCDDTEDLITHLTPSSDKSFTFIDPRHFANLEEGEAVSFSLHSFRKNGDSFWARIILQALENRDMIEGIITDISDQVKADMELREAIVRAEQAQQDAEEANKAKSRFLANISHEIRTPLNGIIGFTEIIMASIHSPEGQQYAEKILDESENLMTLINQLLDISKIEAHQLQLNRGSFYLRNLLAETISFIRLRARNKGLNISVEYDDSIPLCITSDSYRLRQVLLNLLSNAVKFTSQGGILLKASLLEQTGENLILQFEIHDTGIGIPEEMHQLIFESFVQADSSISKQYGGTGLGISISRDLVSIMGGKIWLESREGEGSRFFFTISCQQAEPYDPDENQARNPSQFTRTSLEGIRVLVVEDYPTNREIAQHHLQAAGCIVDMAGNGAMALTRAAHRHYDIILMDVHMPEMDGLEATRKLRDMTGVRDIPIIGLTANVLPSIREECSQAGMNDMLTKPLRKRELLETLELWCTRKQLHTVASVKEAAVSAEVPEPDQGPEPLPLDYQSVLEEMDGNRSAVQEIIMGFLDNLERQKILLERGIEDMDLVLIHREAHSIKGGALNLNAPDLASWARALEKGAAENYIEMIPVLYRNLKQKMDELLDCRDRIRLIR